MCTRRQAKKFGREVLDRDLVQVRRIETFEIGIVTVPVEDHGVVEEGIGLMRERVR